MADVIAGILQSKRGKYDDGEALTVVVASDGAAPVHPIPVPILLVLSSQQIRSAHAEPVVSAFEIGCR